MIVKSIVNGVSDTRKVFQRINNIEVKVASEEDPISLINSIDELI